MRRDLSTNGVRITVTMLISVAGVLALAGCGGNTPTRPTSPSITHPPAIRASPSSTTTGPGANYFSMSPVTPTGITGNEIDDASGPGSRSMSPLPTAGVLEVIYSCGLGKSMTIIRKPDINVTTSCVGGPSLVTFDKSPANANPVVISLSDAAAPWTVRLLLDQS